MIGGLLIVDRRSGRSEITHMACKLHSAICASFGAVSRHEGEAIYRFIIAGTRAVRGYLIVYSGRERAVSRQRSCRYAPVGP